MSLYIRVQLSFWNHVKTLRLRARIGDDAFWVPPRLWSYAAEAKPDGDFSGYTSAELAMLAGCPKHAASIRQDLIDCGFMDADGRLHDWAEHNGYHSTFSERAKAAAEARWSSGKEKKRKRKEMKGKERRQALLGACLTDASSINTTTTEGSQDPADAEKAWLDQLKAQYSQLGVDVDREIIKARAWLLSPRGKRRKFTRQFLVNWLSGADAAVSEPKSSKGEW